MQSIGTYPNVELMDETDQRSRRATELDIEISGIPDNIDQMTPQEKKEFFERKKEEIRLRRLKEQEELNDVPLRLSAEEREKLTPAQHEARNRKKCFRWKTKVNAFVASFRESSAILSFLNNEPPAEDHLQHCCWRLGKVMGSPYTTILVSIGVITNAVLMGLYADEVIDHKTFKMLITFFMVFFTLEILLKMVAYGPRLYLRDNWNKFDFGVVSLSLLELALTSVIDMDSVASILRLLRIFRIARLISSLKELEFVVRSFAMSMGAAMWVNVLTILVLFVFGLIGQMLFGEDEQLAADTAYMEFGTGGNSRELFGSVLRGMLTTFQVMTMNWVMPARTVSETRGVGWFFFVFVMMFAGLGILNLYTAVYVDKMRLLSSRQALKAERLKRERKKDLMLDLGDVLRMMDVDDSGSLDRTELAEGLHWLSAGPAYRESDEGLIGFDGGNLRGTRLQGGADVRTKLLKELEEFDISIEQIQLAADNYVKMIPYGEDLEIKYRDFLETLFTMHDPVKRIQVAEMHAQIENRIACNSASIDKVESQLDAILLHLSDAITAEKQDRPMFPFPRT